MRARNERERTHGSFVEDPRFAPLATGEDPRSVVEDPRFALLASGEDPRVLVEDPWFSLPRRGRTHERS